MPISIPTALLIGGAVSAGGAVASAEIGSNAATSAANTQAAAADQASTLQTELGQEGVNLQTEQLNAEEQNAYPFLASGYGAEANLSNLLGLDVNGNYATGPSTFSAPGIPGVAPGTGGTPGTGGLTPGGTAPLSSLVNPSLGAKGSLLAPFGQTFTPPTNVTEANDPGYQFRLDQGVQALQNSAAARGNLLTGQTAKDITDYGQNYASNEYQNVYNRALTDFQQSYNMYQNQQANTFNRLSALAGGGQTQAAQLGSAGQSGVSGINNILLGTGSEVGSNLQNAGAARASGYVGSANAINGGLSSLSSLAYLPMLNNIYGGSSSGAAPSGGYGDSGPINPGYAYNPSTGIYTG